MRTDRRAGTGKIQRATLDGSNIEDLVTGLDYPASIALDIAGGHMYWDGLGGGVKSSVPLWMVPMSKTSSSSLHGVVSQVLP